MKLMLVKNHPLTNFSFRSPTVTLCTDLYDEALRLNDDETQFNQLHGYNQRSNTNMRSEEEKVFLKALKATVEEGRAGGCGREKLVGTGDLKLDMLIYTDPADLRQPHAQVMKARLSGKLLTTLQKICGRNFKLNVNVNSVQVNDQYGGNYGAGTFDFNAKVQMGTTNKCEGTFLSSSANANNVSTFLSYWNQSQNGYVYGNGYKFTGNVSVELEATITDIKSYKGMIKPDFRIIKKILSDKLSSDVEIIAENGAVIKSHKCFLSAHSPVLNAMFNSDLKKATNAGKLEMSEMTEGGVKALLAYIYYWDIKEAEEHADIALELFKAGHKYQIENLEKVMKALLLHLANERFTVEAALDLFFFSRYLEGGDELKMKSIRVLKTCYEELQSSGVYQNLFKEDPNAAKELCTNIVLAWKSETGK